MSSRLPDFADPSRLCDQGRTFEGRVALREFQRLTPLLASKDGEAAFTLVFGNDREHGHVVSGTVEAELELVCQRCLTPMKLRVDGAFVLGVVHGPEEAARLPDDLEPLLDQEGGLVPRDLIEDEILLAIPASPMHDPHECVVDLSRINASGRSADVDEPQRTNPFAVLREPQNDDEPKS